MSTSNTHFEAELKRLIDEEIIRIKENLAYGQAVTDYAEYRYQTGQISALRRVMSDYCDEVTKLLNER